MPNPVALFLWNIENPPLHLNSSRKFLRELFSFNILIEFIIQYLYHQIQPSRGKQKVKNKGREGRGARGKRRNSTLITFYSIRVYNATLPPGAQPTMKSERGSECKKKKS